ncbi:hypothetical protein PHJA_000161200 [Phtheirospermum japonicum]|uniref:Uncharacterized protein n=1 Tax=Phtheirospermum japonicum TaxID=374723 RepID=A0A830B583_9LAMI|nr:hypothetical protein PHJA_000161200 [Phtheirospermum japonicum]
MDGLIPIVYKSLKRSKTRRQYQCLSPSSAAPITHTYNIADFYINENDHHHGYLSRKYDDQYVNRAPGLRGAHLRRFNSTHIDGGGARGFGLEEVDSSAAKSKQLVRFRSHRMFSCVPGA